MKKYYKATITYTMDEGHPDFSITDYGRFNNKKAEHFYEDIYGIDTDYCEGDGVKEYIEEDLLLVAGGGYDREHIHNVNISIHEIPRKDREKEFQEIKKRQSLHSEIAKIYIEAFEKIMGEMFNKQEA